MIGTVIEIKKKVSPQLFAQIKPAAKAGLLAGAETLKSFLVVYPPERHGPAIWSQDKEKRLKQLRGFFYHLRQGDIDVPYRRGQSAKSQTLSKRWNDQVVVDTDVEIAVSLGNNATYGPLVHDRDRQTRYHQLTGWITVQQVKEEHEQKVVEDVNEAIGKEIQRINGKN